MESTVFWSISELERRGFPKSEGLLSYSFNLGTPHHGGGQSSGYPMKGVKDMSVTRYYDANSVLLLTAAASGEVFPVISIWSAVKKENTTLTKVKFNLKNCIVSGYATDNANPKGDKQVDQVSINFESFEFDDK